MIIVIFELLIVIIRNTQFRALLGIKPQVKNIVLDSISDGIETADNSTKSGRFKFYEYKIMVSIVLLMLIYGVCVIIYVINKVIVYMVKGIRAAFKPFKGAFKKAGLGKLPKIPYNCIPIPKYIQFYYYMFLKTPKQCKFKSKKSNKRQSNTKYTSFGTILNNLIKSMFRLTPIIIWSFFAILLLCYVIFKMLQNIHPLEPY
jgi:hypothetical protein